MEFAPLMSYRTGVHHFAYFDPLLEMMESLKKFIFQNDHELY